jgi:hypothetical protein
MCVADNRVRSEYCGLQTGPAVCGAGRHSALRQPMSTRHLDDLRAQARYARQRYDLYKARAYGQRPTSPARMRELQRACEQAEARLHAAEAQERLGGITDDGVPGAGGG